VSADRTTPATDEEGLSLVGDAACPIMNFREGPGGAIAATGALLQEPPVRTTRATCS
jgi:hypothetical protein